MSSEAAAEPLGDAGGVADAGAHAATVASATSRAATTAGARNLGFMADRVPVRPEVGRGTNRTGWRRVAR